MQAPIDDPIRPRKRASPGPLPGPCFLLGTVKFKPQPWFNWNVTGSIVLIGVFSPRRYEMKRSWRVPIFLSVVSNERGDMGYWVSSRNVVVVIRARRLAWWPRLKIWLGRFRKGKP